MFARQVRCQHKFDQMASTTFIVIGQKDRLKEILENRAGQSNIRIYENEGINSLQLNAIRYSALHMDSSFHTGQL